MPLTADAVRAHLHTACFGRSLTVYEEVDSTNTAARLLAAEGAPEGTAVAACRQQAGRGRRGREFHSPEGGIYLSVILRPAVPVSPGLITSCAAVAAARAIRRLTGLDVGIKWVNDLFLNGRKVAGILAEGELSPTGELEYIILGIGINVAAVPLPAAVADIATSLEAEGCRPALGALIAALLEEWETAYATLPSGDFLEDSRRLSVVLGKTVTVLRGEESFPAVAEAIDDQGQLVVRTADGPLTLTSGEVSLRL